MAQMGRVTAALYYLQAILSFEILQQAGVTVRLMQTVHYTVVSSRKRITELLMLNTATLSCMSRIFAYG